MRALSGIVGYFALVAFILRVGWYEPLGNLFKSPAEVAAINAPLPTSVPTPVPTPRPIDRGHTKLDTGRPY